jgi:protein tyrosine phosphatase (PTP) superfamily phosphohydrolase (DUF442 family)
MSNYPFPTINDLTFVAYSGARIVLDGFYVTGQPSTAAYAALAQTAGVKSVVCVRSPSETVATPPPVPPAPPFDTHESAELGKLGVSYTNIPIERTMTQAQFDTAATDAALTLLANYWQGPALIHCSTGDRASSAFAVLLILAAGQTNAQVVDYATNCLLLANPNMIALVQGYSVPQAMADRSQAIKGSLPRKK